MTDERATDRKAKMAMIAIIVAVLAGSVIYRLLAWQRLEHTSMVFIGIPAILAIAVAMLSPSTATGTSIKAVTMILLLSGIVFGEALVCILFAAPLFYLVAIVIGLIVDRRRDAKRAMPEVRTLMFITIALTPASLEGVLPGFEFNRDEHVTASRSVNASAADVTAILARTPRFERPLPLFLQLGFPQPGATHGAGLHRGSVRWVEFVHGHHPGALRLVVESSEPGHVIFAVTGDDSYITHWLSWQRAEVRWRELSPTRTEVRWTLSYRRRLDPAWYFKPLERYGTSLAAGYLIDTLATPERD